MSLLQENVYFSYRKVNKNAYFTLFEVNKNVSLVIFNMSKITSRCCGGSAPCTQELAIERIFVSPKERYLPRIDFNCRSD